MSARELGLSSLFEHLLGNVSQTPVCVRSRYAWWSDKLSQNVGAASNLLYILQFKMDCLRLCTSGRDEAAHSCSMLSECRQSHSMRWPLAFYVLALVYIVRFLTIFFCALVREFSLSSLPNISFLSFVWSFGNEPYTGQNILFTVVSIYYVLRWLHLPFWKRWACGV